MRKWLFYSVFVLVACGGDGWIESIPTLPEIDAITISPDSMVQMDGGGKIVVTAEVTVYDEGMDIASLWIRKPDGQTIEFDEALFAVSGTLIESFEVSTAEIGVHAIEFWLIDRAGLTSGHRTAEFTVNWDLPASEWTSRVGGLPYNLNDVIWDGSVFIAVGGDGAILTSTDGIDWAERDSGTESDLRSIAAWGSDIVAIGDEVVLLSTDHGMSWVTRNSPADINLDAVAINSAQIVIGGTVPDPDADPDSFAGDIRVFVLSDDRGDTWKTIELQSSGWSTSVSDLVYADKLFVATANDYDIMSFGGAQVLVSSDGIVWTEALRNENSNLSTVIHDGSRFIVGGYGTVLSSMDGYNWSEFDIPVGELDYTGAASSGSKLMLAGGCGWFGCGSYEIEYPAGISSTDGGASWDIFDIDGDYESEGLAWGNGRFVSVGDGAIYTTE